MNLSEISKGYFNLFVKNPKNLDLFLMHRNIERLSADITKQAKIDVEQNADLTL